MVFKWGEGTQISPPTNLISRSLTKNKIRCAGLTDKPDFCPIWILRGDHADQATINNTGRCIGPSGS